MPAVPDNKSKIKRPTFDSSISFNAFKFHFETVANKNLSNDEEIALEPIMALKRSAAAVLGTTCWSCENYKNIIEALSQKYGGDAYLFWRKSSEDVDQFKID